MKARQSDEIRVDPDDLLDDQEAAKKLRQQRQTLAAWRCEGKGPQYIKIGRRIYYQPSAIAAYLATRIVVPRSKL